MKPTSVCGVALLCGLFVLVLATPAWPEGIRFTRSDGVLFLNCADVAKALDLQFEIIQPARLITFCRTSDESFCIPVRLAAGNHRGAGNDFQVAATVLSQALRFHVVESGETVTAQRMSAAPQAPAQTLAPGYNNIWGPGRGFQPGDTLPDIPLIDLDGNEVRFAQFLGKRYILYCWASW